MRLQVVQRELEAGLDRADARRDHSVRRDAAQAHADEREKAHVGARGPGRDPQRDRHEVQQQEKRYDDDDQDAQYAGDARLQSAHVSSFSLVLVIWRTTMRLPSTRKTSIGVPGSMSSPSDTTSTRAPSMSAIPAGRSGEAARPRLPSQRRSLSGSVPRPVSRMSHRPNGVRRMKRSSRKLASTATSSEIRIRPAANMKNSGVAPAPTTLMTSAARSARMPRMPATPKPGMTKNSTASSARPPSASKSSPQPASCTSQWPQKNAARLPTPMAPARPRPGVRNSMMMPSMPMVTSSELSTGFVRKRTTFSAQF